MAPFTVPYARNKDFIVRNDEDIVARLDTLPSGRGAYHQRVALTGQVGIGKTQVAIEYAHRVHEADPSMAVFWVDGSSALYFEQSYLKIAEAANIVTAEKLASRGSLALTTEPEVLRHAQQDILASIANWLASKVSGRWLMIIDTANDANVFFETPREEMILTGASISNGPPREKLIDYLPSPRHGTILFITRDGDTGERLTGSGKSVEIKEMTRSESEQFICSLLEKRFNELEEEEKLALSELVDELDRLPLALVQAAVIILSLKLTVANYLAAFKTFKGQYIDMRKESEPVDKALRAEISDSVSSSWTLVYRLVESIHRPATWLLFMMAVLDAESISRTVLERPGAMAAHAKGEDFNVTEFEEAINLLKGFHLITEHFGGERFSMTTLVRSAIRQYLILNEKYQIETIQTLAIVANLFMESEDKQSSWMNMFLCLPFALRILSVSKPQEKEEIHIQAGLSGRVSSFMNQNGLNNRMALGLAVQAVNSHTNAYGETEMITIQDMKIWAAILLARREYKDAEVVLKQALYLCPIQENIKNASENMRLNLISYYTMALRGQGKSGDVLDVLQDIYDFGKSERGPEDRLTLITQVNLAVEFIRNKQLEEAEELLNQALKLTENAGLSGKKERQKIILNLGQLYEKQERYLEAETSFRSLVSELKEECGETDPEYLKALVSLAVVYWRQKRLSEAEDTLRKVLKIEEHISSNNISPDMLGTIEWLAIVLEDQGNDEADIFFQRAIRGYEKTLGSTHPTTVKCWKNYQFFLDKKISAEKSIHASLSELTITEKKPV